MFDRRNKVAKAEIDRLDTDVREMTGINRKNQLEIMRLHDISKARDQDNQNDTFKGQNMVEDIQKYEKDIDRLNAVLE